jgi:hypothetical protein
MVDGYVFEKCHMYALSCVNAIIWSWHVLVAWLCLICGWIASLLIIWSQRLICHHECLALLLYLVEGHQFPFVAFYDSCHVTSRNGCHLRCHACKPSHLRYHACTPCHQSKRGKPRQIRAWHMDFTWIHGPIRAPKPPQEHVYTGDRLKCPQDSHPEEAHPEWGPLGIGRPYRIGRTDLGSVNPWLPCGACPLVLEAIPGVFHSLRQCFGL